MQMIVFLHEEEIGEAEDEDDGDKIDPMCQMSVRNQIHHYQ